MSTATLARVDALKAELDTIRPLKPEHEQRLWQKLRLEWNYNSNHIEGNTLTYGETYLLLIHGQTNGGHSMREFEEMKAHDVAVSMVAVWANDKQRTLMENDVRSLNAILLKEPFWKEATTVKDQPTQIQVIPGKYKNTGNSVRQPDGTLFHYASPEEVPAKMQDLMEWYNTPSDLHPLQKVALLHHRFIVIHPFGDGNGRTARLLVNYHLMRHGYMPLVVKSADKLNYLRCLKLADAGDMLPFSEYLAEQEAWVLELAIKAAKGRSIEEPTDIDKEIALFKAKTNKTDGPREERTAEVLARTFRVSLRPMFERFIDEMDSFVELFKTTRHHVVIGSYNTHYGRNSCVRAMENAFNELEFSALSKQGKPVQVASRTNDFKDLAPETLMELAITISFDDYLHGGTNIFNAFGNLMVTFQQYTYTIESSGPAVPRKELLYHQTLTPDVITAIVSAAKRHTWEGIKSTLGE